MALSRWRSGDNFFPYRKNLPSTLPHEILSEELTRVSIRFAFGQKRPIELDYPEVLSEIICMLIECLRCGLDTNALHHPQRNNSALPLQQKA